MEGMRSRLSVARRCERSEQIERSEQDHYVNNNLNNVNKNMNSIGVNAVWRECNDGEMQ